VPLVERRENKNILIVRDESSPLWRENPISLLLYLKKIHITTMYYSFSDVLETLKDILNFALYKIILRKYIICLKNKTFIVRLQVFAIKFPSHIKKHSKCTTSSASSASSYVVLILRHSR